MKQRTSPLERSVIPKLGFFLSMLIISQALVCRVAFSQVQFTSGIINYDQYCTACNYPPYGPGPGAIGLAGDLWNHGQLGSPTLIPHLTRTDGSATSVGWTIVSGGGVSIALGGRYGWLFSEASLYYNASITGLTPNQQYDLYVFSTFYGNQVNVNGVTFSTPPIRGGPDTEVMILGAQYDLHTVTANASGSLVFDGGYITAWQLTPVPEPSGISLAWLALGTFVYNIGISRRTGRFGN